MEESITTKLLMNARKKQSDSTGYWSDETMKHFNNAPHWQIYKWIPVLAKGGGQQDLLVQEARSSWESQQDAESYGETRSNTADCRIPGITISTVKLHYARRQNKVTKLIEMFEKHQHKEQFLKDRSQKQEINKFSEESQQLLVDMNHTEIFELCENSAKLQCPDCNSFSEIGIIYCSCGRILKYKRSPTTIQKANNDYTSIPGFVIKNSIRGPKHGVVLQGEADA